MAKSKKIAEFIDNFRIISGGVSTFLGFCFATSAIYELHAEKKLFPVVEKYNLISIVNPIVKTIDDLNFQQKTSIALPLLAFGNLMLLSSQKPRNPSI